MQLNRCPICHTRISLDALAQDEAGRELLGLLAKLDTDSGSALVGYLGLFRSHTRDLANDRALKLAREALSFGPVLTVAQAMRKTVEQIQAKWSANVPDNADISAIHGDRGKPLNNHNYLKRVLEDSPSPQPSPTGRGSESAGDLVPLSPRERAGVRGNSKTAQALQALEDFKHGR